MHRGPAGELGVNPRLRLEEAHLDQLIEQPAEQPKGFGDRERSERQAKQTGLGYRVLDVCPAGHGEPAASAKRRFTRGHLVETSLHGAQELLHDPLGDCGDEVVEIGKMPVGGIVRDADSPREASNPQTTGPLFMHRGDRRIEESLP